MYGVVSLDLDEGLADQASGLMHVRGALGVELRDAIEAPPPAVPRPAAGRATVIGYFPGAVDASAVAVELASELERRDAGRIVATVSHCDDEDWAESFKAHFPPIRIGTRLWVLPPWEPAPVDVTAVVIEPGMAFGTGAHETTALCLEALAARDLTRVGVLDVGCGSGILGIAARRLGADPVAMIDNDPEAVGIARVNAARNGLPDLEIKGTPIELVGGRFGIVVANILARTLIALAEPIARRVAAGGSLLLSGILASQADEVRDVYERHGLVFHAIETRGEWCLIVMTARKVLVTR